ncbi:MAG: sugar phosphate isomerase/epimerase [Fuerstiella sp.]|nr:sugar phosphate isomerase/epimerase [Fuerstiella sp.]
MQIAGSTRSLWEMSPGQACSQLQDLGFDKCELWLNDSYDQLKVSDVVSNADSVISELRESSRVSPVAIFVDQEVSSAEFRKVVDFSRALRIAQMTIEASPLGTPFNTEIDRLRERHHICHEAGIRLSILTRRGLLTEDPLTATELCQSVKGLGITLDPTCYIFRPEQVSWDMVFDHTLHCHLRDSSSSQAQVSCGLGDADFNRITATLQNIDFDRSLCVDLLPQTMSGEERLLELRKLRLLLESML